VDIRELLKKGIQELGFSPETDKLTAFINYLSELKKWNKAYSLTGLEKDEDIIIKHFLDSLLYLRPIPQGEIRVVDVGSGAGFPGIPLKIMRPEIELYLLEPSKKKSAFLRHVIWLLTLKKIEVIEKRLEEVKVNRELPVSVDVAVTRALFDIKDFIKKASPVVKKGGILIFNKGPKVKEEIAHVRDKRYEIIKIGLPLSDIKRYIVTVTL